MDVARARALGEADEIFQNFRRGSGGSFFVSAGRLGLFHGHIFISQKSTSVSLTPGFSRVLMAIGNGQPFQRLAGLTQNR